MIETLTLALAASPLYSTLRENLKGKTKPDFVENKEKLFLFLYQTWCYNPVSTLTLCLMSRNYELAYNLIPRFTMIEMDTPRLI
jgi:vacuole morphology and inheritance protein 14